MIEVFLSHSLRGLPVRFVPALTIVGVRVVELQRDLRKRVGELQAALAAVKRLEGLIPICSYCKRVRDDQDYWHQVESYIAERSEARFSHGICPECFSRIVEPQLRAEQPTPAAASPEPSPS